jgi:hypothetical protein
MSFLRLLTAGAVATVALAGIAQSASAAEVYISGDIFWAPGTTTTAFSKASEQSSFGFDVDSVLGSGSSPTATVTNFTYDLNNIPVTAASLTSIKFVSTGFDLDFSNGTVIAISGANIGNIGSGNDITESGFDLVSAAVNPPHGTTGQGSVVVSVSAVPLPAAMPMFVAGLAGLGFIAWRRKTV